MSSFGSPNKVVSLSQWNTASPGHDTGGSNNTSVRINALFLCVYIWAVLCKSSHSDIDMWGRVWMSRFRRVWTSLKFYKENPFFFFFFYFLKIHEKQKLKIILTVNNQNIHQRNKCTSYTNLLRNTLWSVINMTWKPMEGSFDFTRICGIHVTRANQRFLNCRH